MIDIHVKHLRMKVDAKTGVRVVWSRGKKQAKTQTKFLTESLDKAVFDEKFQINTIVDIDPVTGIPNKEKMSKMSICLDRNSGGTEIAETDFNMANFKFGEYTITRLHLKQSAGNATIEVDSENTFIEIGLRGQRVDGLLTNRGSKALASSTWSKLGSVSSSYNPANSMMDPEQRDANNALTQEIEKMKKDMKLMKKEFERDKAQKNTKINNLLTDLENAKTDLEYTQKEKSKLLMQKDAIEMDYQSL